MRIPALLRVPRNVVELFVITNLGFLAVDVFVAHEVNAFERQVEWIPVYFSAIAPALLVLGAIARSARKPLGLLVGACSLIVGIAGMLFHLESHFFDEQTLKSLVYTAPFVAPLAYAGLGLLLIMDRTTDPESSDWARWVVFLALGGFAGNFVLSLADHAQNGFFNRAEWLPVIASALACAFLFMVVVRPLDRRLLQATAWLMAAQMLIGGIGFGLHLRANLEAPSPRLVERFLYGAPIFAPLLFANLAILAALGMWALVRHSER
jgi:hypothetical protein